MTNKEKYREFCKKEKNIPIFSKDWWLDSVCPENKYWDVILIEKGGQIVASMPYIVGRKHNFKTIEMPKLTQNLGPYIKYPEKQKYETKLSYEKEIMTEIIEQIPDVASFSQNFNYRITNWLPFYWNGFKQTTRYTYIINDLSNLESVYNNISSAYRNKIKKAQKSVDVKQDLPIEEFFKINEMTFLRQGLKSPISLNFLIKHDKSLSENNSRKIFFAIDSNNQIHSALYLTWDYTSSYVHMVGENPELRKSSAGILLIWEAIKFTKKVLKLNKFDFEGSMIERVEPVRRSFGATQHPYFSISKTYSKFYKLLSLGKEAINILRN